MLRKAILLLLLTMAAAGGAYQAEAKKRMPRNKNGSIMSLLAQVAEETGVPLRVLARFAKIESGMNPNNGNRKYKGLFALSKNEFRRGGGQGSIFDPKENAHSFANLYKAKVRAFERQTGRPPSDAELYMIHQQGEAGQRAHMANPDNTAWKNVRRFYGSDAVARQAIWGNVPGPVQRQFRRAGMSVNDITSRQFTQMWADRVGGDQREVAGYEMTPPNPQRSNRYAEMPSETAERNMNLPDRRVASAPSYEDAVSQSADWRPKVVSLPPDARDTPDPLSPMENRVPLPVRRREEGEVSAAGTSPTEWLDNAFGKPFGELFANGLDNEIDFSKVNARDGNTQLGKGVLGQALGIPPQPPIFRDFFRSMFK